MHEWNRFSWSAWCLREFWILSVPLLWSMLFCFVHLLSFPFFVVVVVVAPSVETCVICSFFLYFSLCMLAVSGCDCLCQMNRYQNGPRESTLATNTQQNCIFDRSCNKPNHRTTIIWDMLWKMYVLEKFAYKAHGSDHWIHIHTENLISSVNRCVWLFLLLFFHCKYIPCVCLCVFMVNVVVVVDFVLFLAIVCKLQFTIYNRHTYTGKHKHTCIWPNIL